MTRVVATEDVLGGEPRIEGTRIGVLDLYELVVTGGNTPEDVADQLDSSLGEVYTALAYYYDHPEEMRKLRKQRDNLRAELAENAVQPPETVQ